MTRLNVGNIRHPDGTDDNINLDSSGRVGIGTTSPAAPLSVTSGTNLAYPTQVNAQLHINNSAGAAGALIASDTIGNIFFADTASNNAGRIYYDHTSNFLAVNVNSAERARIDSSGNFKFDSGFGSVATAYGVRAWANFQGTNTVSIRSSGNISSVTDNGTGDYTVSFTSSLSSNYTWALNARSDDNNASSQSFVGVTANSETPSTSSFRMSAVTPVNNTRQDHKYIVCTFVR